MRSDRPLEGGAVLKRRPAVLGAVWLALAVGGALLAWTLKDLPDPRPLGDPAWVRQRFALEEWCRLKDCSAPAVRAILVSEDDTFYRHHGLRMDQWTRAAWDDLLKLRYRRGASSITQQVVKNAFLDGRKTLPRKIKEMALARRADRLVGKRALLEDYLNLAEWGPRKERGICFAARRYFGKRPAELSARDGALLSWLLPDPRGRGSALVRGELPPRARRHVRIILARLVVEGSLDGTEAAAELREPFPFDNGTAPVELSPAAGLGAEAAGDDDTAGDDADDAVPDTDSKEQ